MTDPVQAAAALAARIAQEVRDAAGAGLDAARIFLTARVKEELSVAAPRKRVKGLNGDFYYRATTPATPGAAPRKLSGRYRQTVTSEKVGPLKAILGANAKSASGFSYPKHHEIKDSAHPSSGQHQAFQPVFERYKQDVMRIVGGTVVLKVGG